MVNPLKWNIAKFLQNFADFVIIKTQNSFFRKINWDLFFFLQGYTYTDFQNLFSMKVTLEDHLKVVSMDVGRCCRLFL